MKTPDEIKKGLYCCGTTDVSCTNCPYDEDCHTQGDGYCSVEDDALIYIERLGSRLAQVERERGAAVADLESVDEKYEILKSMIDDVTFNHEPYGLYLDFRAAADAIVEHEHADVWRDVCAGKGAEAESEAVRDGRKLQKRKAGNVPAVRKPMRVRHEDAGSAGHGKAGARGSAQRKFCTGPAYAEDHQGDEQEVEEMSIARSIKRKKMLAEKGRTTCPKCHAKLIEKPGYGTVCAECGWWKKEAGKHDP